MGIDFENETVYDAEQAGAADTDTAKDGIEEPTEPCEDGEDFGNSTEFEESAKSPDEVGVDYAALERDDLLALRNEFYEARGLRSLAELDNPVRFAELREMGLSPTEAYLATKKRTAPDNRAHLRGSMPRGASSSYTGMSRAELSYARELFSGMSDGEIQRLYKRVSKQ